jgi:hypothetical protein
VLVFVIVTLTRMSMRGEVVGGGVLTWSGCRVVVVSVFVWIRQGDEGEIPGGVQTHSK